MKNFHSWSRHRIVQCRQIEMLLILKIRKMHIAELVFVFNASWIRSFQARLSNLWSWIIRIQKDKNTTFLQTQTRNKFKLKWSKNNWLFQTICDYSTLNLFRYFWISEGFSIRFAAIGRKRVTLISFPMHEQSSLSYFNTVSKRWGHGYVSKVSPKFTVQYREAFIVCCSPTTVNEKLWLF